MHLLLLLATALGGPLLTSSDTPVFELPVNGSATIPSPPVSQVVVLDEHICTASVEAGIVRLVGVNRGETIVLVWVEGQADDRPVTVLVHVSAPTPAPVEKQMTPEERDAIGHGFVGPADMSPLEYDVMLPATWKVQGALVHKGAAGCLDFSGFPEEPLMAISGNGSATWSGACPKTLDVDVLLAFPEGEPWIAAMELLQDAGVTVGGC